MDTETHHFYATQSAVSDPGGRLPDGLPTDVASLQRIARGLVIHYRGDDPIGNGVAPERLREIDTRYADTMLDRLQALRAGPRAAGPGGGAPPPGADRRLLP